jgi:hypothetical protein
MRGESVAHVTPVGLLNLLDGADDGRSGHTRWTGNSSSGSGQGWRASMSSTET